MVTTVTVWKKVRIISSFLIDLCGSLGVLEPYGSPLSQHTRRKSNCENNIAPPSWWGSWYWTAQSEGWQSQCSRSGLGHSILLSEKFLAEPCELAGEYAYRHKGHAQHCPTQPRWYNGDNVMSLWRVFRCIFIVQKLWPKQELKIQSNHTPSMEWRRGWEGCCFTAVDPIGAEGEHSSIRANSNHKQKHDHSFLHRRKSFALWY